MPGAGPTMGDLTNWANKADAADYGAAAPSPMTMNVGANNPLGQGGSGSILGKILGGLSQAAGGMQGGALGRQPTMMGGMQDGMQGNNSPFALNQTELDQLRKAITHITGLLQTKGGETGQGANNIQTAQNALNNYTGLE